MDPVRISYRWTADELLEAQKTHNAAVLSPGIVIVLTVFYFLMTCLGFLMIVLGVQRGDDVSGFPIGFTAFWLLWLALMQLGSGPVHRFIVRNRFPLRKDANTTLNFEFSSRGIKLTSSSNVEVAAPWTQYSKLREGDNGYLLYFGKQFYWLPKLAFDGHESKERLKSWVLDANIPVIVKGKRVRP